MSQFTPLVSKMTSLVDRLTEKPSEDKRQKVWSEAFAEELQVVNTRRGEKKLDEDKNLVGIAFSGGGIRSATFGLGVLEGLKKYNLLSQIDYISTVSGGGYVGAWFTANCKRAADNLAEKLAKQRAANPSATPITLNPENPWLDTSAHWDESIDHLRRYSNYLSPIVGFFSADTWSMAMVWLRNTILVQLTVFLAIAIVLLLPRPLFRLFEYWPESGDWRWATIILFIIGVVGIAGNQRRMNTDNPWLLKSENWRKGLAGALAFGAFAVVASIHWDFKPFKSVPGQEILSVFIGCLLLGAGFCLQPVGIVFLNLIGASKTALSNSYKILICKWKGRDESTVNKVKYESLAEINYDQSWVQFAVVIPMLITGMLVAAILWGQSQPGLSHEQDLAKFDTFGGFFMNAWKHWPFPLSVVFGSLWLLSFCSVRTLKDAKCVWAAILAPIPSMLILHALLAGIMLLLHGWVGLGSEGKWYAFAWTPTLVLYSFALAIVMLLGILGRQSTEGAREWWSRFGAWLGIYGFAWTIVNVAATYGPLWMAMLFSYNWAGLFASGWIGTTLAGLFAGKSDSTGAAKEKSVSQKAMEVVAGIAPFVFIAGMLMAVSTVLNLLIITNSDLNWKDFPQLRDDHWNLLFNANLGVVWALLVGTILATLLLAARVDINEFGLNAFYRSRLVRCYLGATRKPSERNPQRFTQFDDDDDLKLASLNKVAAPGDPLSGPFHIVNCALNLGGSSDLALHTRHSANFTLTPLRCGSNYQSRDEQGDKTSAMEMGFRSTEVFGSSDGQPTLGQAISVSGAAASPNMGYHTSPVVAFLMTLFNLRLGWWFPNPRLRDNDTPSPWFSLRYLVMELFGGADDHSKFLAISDGGHFENLAAYELIKRRCKVIIISDGECDPNLQFEGLGTLIRMCEVDFKATIKIDVGSIRHGSDSKWSTNRCAVGKITYHDEYCNVIGTGTFIYFKASMTGHEGTGIQQYQSTHITFPHESTADQFYGEDQFESYRALGRDIATATLKLVHDPEAMLNLIAMADQLESVCSPTLHNVDRFTQLSAKLIDLWSLLGENSHFKDLDKEFAGKWPDPVPEGFRSAFYLCSEMLQLMENVYMDLNLEETWDHPDTLGWRTTFKTWAEAPAIKKTWELTSDTYGLRFQYFCQRHLKLQASKKYSASSGY